MGTDTALAVLSDRPRLLYDYFKQLFAQVTNPPLDAIREELVTSMESTIGPGAQPARAASPSRAGRSRSRTRCIDNEELAKLRARRRRAASRSITLPMLFDRSPTAPRASSGRSSDLQPARERGGRRRATTSSSCRTAASTASTRADSEPAGDGRRAPSPGAARATRTRCGLVVETGDAREVHHCALLIGYGAGAVNPYLAFETLDDMIRAGHARPASTATKAVQELHQGAQQGHPQGDVQDGHLDAAELLRRADLRGDRPRTAICRPLLHRHGLAHRRRRAST